MGWGGALFLSCSGGSGVRIGVRIKSRRMDNPRGREAKIQEGQKEREGGSDRAHWGWRGEGTTFHEDGARVGGEESSKQSGRPGLCQSLLCCSSLGDLGQVTHHSGIQVSICKKRGLR